MSAGDNFRLIDCPRCSYDLQGSPDEGRCPECGFGYSPRTFALSLLEVLPGVDRSSELMMVGIPGAIVMVFLVLANVLSCGGSILLLALLVGIVILPARVLRVMARRRGRTAHAVVVHDDTIVKRQFRSMTEVRFADVTRLEIAVGPGSEHRITVFAKDRWNDWPCLWLDGEFEATSHQARWIRDELDARLKDAMGSNQSRTL